MARIGKPNSPADLLGYMETGVQGIVMPHVHSRAGVELLVEGTKYHPVGKRSAGAMRPGDFGVGMNSADYYRRANEESLLVALVEDVEGIENIDDIVSVPELDVLLVGPGDLALAMDKLHAPALPPISISLPQLPEHHWIHTALLANARALLEEADRLEGILPGQIPVERVAPLWQRVAECWARVRLLGG